MARSWTKAQAQAISARKGPLLVSAAAGSGKTSVLTQRAIALVCDPQNPVDVDKLLIVTYTKAAAAEMRQRIGEGLSRLIQEQPDNLRLLGQQALLGGASIGTIHAFCADLIRRNFEHLNISHDFVVGEEGELSLLRQDCARDVVEEFYRRDDALGGAFSALVELLSTGKDDTRLVEVVLSLYDFARTHPFYHNWMDRIQAGYTARNPIQATEWGQALLAYAKDTLDYCAASLERALALMAEDPAMGNAYGGRYASELAQLNLCRDVAEEGAWDQTVHLLRSVRFLPLGRYKGDSPLKGRVRAIRDRCKELIYGLRDSYLNATEEDFARDMEDLAPKLGLLFDLVRAFDEAYTAAKAKKKRLDFADLEHFALSLLVQLDQNGNYLRTPQAVALMERYRHLLVDEYQDVNEVQELLFSCVCQGENLFMVGDAKQSIYSFRLATPRIFLDKKASYSAYTGDEGNFPAKISLEVNFRSRKEVTGAVNYLFGLLMSRRLGEIRYDREEALVCGATYPEQGGDLRPELLIVDTEGYTGKEDADTLEARLVAQKIAGLLKEGYPVTGEDGAPRPCRPGDFCVLMRAPRRRQQTFVKVLEGEGLPVWAQNSDGFLRLREVGMVLSLLQAVDNPLLDLPLVAALLSPLFAFSDSDIAALRLGAKGMPFYLALKEAAKGGGALGERSRAFLEVFAALRREAAVLPTDRLLLELYARTDALAVAQAMPGGESRRANLLLLVDYATQYHQLGYKQVGGFVGFLERLRERGADLEPADTVGETAGAVRLMSIHRAKGLEFPIVILAGTARQFNLRDLNRSYQLHSRYGFACARRNPDTLTQYATLPMQAIRMESRKDILGEELRILYVAATRAKEKLIFTACMGNRGSLRRKLEDAQGEMIAGALNPRALEEARCVLDWLLAALLHHPDGQVLREWGNCTGLPPAGSDTPWRVEILPPPEPGREPAPLQELGRAARPDQAYLQLLKSRADWRYPFAGQTATPTKLAVSAVGAGPGEAFFTRRPDFFAHQGLTAAERGNALHKFMQFADYAAAKADLAGEIDRMARQRYLSAAEAQSLERPKLARFFHGPLAGRIFAGEKIWRELRFLGEYGKELLGDYLEMDDTARVALQGVADCVFVERGKAVIVDYKTDRVKTPQELLERYALQLRLYRHILKDALPVPVGECLLYSFALDRAIPVD